MNVPQIPENSLKEKIEILLKLCAIAEKDFGEDAFEFNEPASVYEIEKWEKENEISIPDSYKEWLAFSKNSMIRDSLAIFYGPEEFITDNEDKSYDVPDDCIVIGELGGWGESLCFSSQTGIIKSFNDGEEYDSPDFGEILDWVIQKLKDTTYYSE